MWKRYMFCEDNDFLWNQSLNIKGVGVWKKHVCRRHLAAVRGDDAEVSGDPVSSLHLHQVSCHHLLGVDLHLLPLADNKSLLKRKEKKSSSPFKTGGVCGTKIIPAVVNPNYLDAWLKLHSPKKQKQKKPSAVSWLKIKLQAGLKSETNLRDHVLKGFHNLGALGLLEVGEATGDDDNSREHYSQVQLQGEDEIHHERFWFPFEKGAFLKHN